MLIEVQSKANSQLKMRSLLRIISRSSYQAEVRFRGVNTSARHFYFAQPSEGGVKNSAGSIARGADVDLSLHRGRRELTEDATTSLSPPPSF